MDEDPLTGRLTANERAIGDLRARISAQQQEIKKLGQSVTESTRLQKALRGELNGVREQLQAYIDEDRDRQVTQAALLDARNKLDRDFGHYQAVRRSATGMLKALRTGITTPARLQEEAERLTVNTPEYWLPPVLVAVFAWISDSQTVAERARDEAIRLDYGKAALFLSLIAARYDRQDAAARWLGEYLRLLDRTALTADFAVLMDAAGGGDLGASARDGLVAVCAQWRDQMRQDGKLAGGQVERWLTFITSKRARMSGTFDLLPDVAVQPGWKVKLEHLEVNAAFGTMKNWLEGQLASTSSRNDNRVVSIDALVGGLIAEHGQGEATLLKRIAELQARARHQGNRAHAAGNPPDGEPVSHPEHDFLTLLTEAALGKPEGEPPAQARLFILALSSPFIRDAICELRQLSMRNKPEAIDIEIHGWRYSVSHNSTAEEAVREFEIHVKAGQEKQLNGFMGIFPGRRETVQGQWQAYAIRGTSEIQRAVTDVHRFYAELEKGDAAAQYCLDLVDNYLGTGASASDLTTVSIRPPLSDASQPAWDLRPRPRLRAPHPADLSGRQPEWFTNWRACPTAAGRLCRSSAWAKGAK